MTDETLEVLVEDHFDPRQEALEAWADAYAAQWDDDPNPYHGDYSEE